MSAQIGGYNSKDEIRMLVDVTPDNFSFLFFFLGWVGKNKVDAFATGTFFFTNLLEFSIGKEFGIFLRGVKLSPHLTYFHTCRLCRFSSVLFVMQALAGVSFGSRGSDSASCLCRAGGRRY